MSREKHKQKAGNWRTAIILVALACVAIITGLYFQPQPGGADEEKVRNLYLQISEGDRERDVGRGFGERILPVEIEGDWALVEIMITRLDTGERADSNFFVFHRILGRWFSSYHSLWL